MGLVRPTYQCVPSHRAPGVTAGSGVAPPASSAARPGELGAGDSLPRAELSGVKSDALLPAAARARSTRCRWFLACSARSIHGQPSGSAAAERLPRGELPSCPRDPRACGATGEVVGVVGRGSLYYGYTTYLLWLYGLLIRYLRPHVPRRRARRVGTAAASAVGCASCHLELGLGLGLGLEAGAGARARARG